MRRVLMGLLVAGVASPAFAQGSPFVKPPLGAPTPAAAFRSITWDMLAPPGWDGMKAFRSMDMQSLNDSDPRAAAMLKQMREAWDKAPVNMALMNQAVRVAGYVVPLEEGKDGLTEFLLVPYHGACVHTPPPPANQIIHVLPRTPVKGVRSMDTVWVSGVLNYARNDSYMGVSSWRIGAVGVEPYGGNVTVPLNAPQLR